MILAEPPSTRRVAPRRIEQFVAGDAQHPGQDPRLGAKAPGGAPDFVHRFHHDLLHRMVVGAVKALPDKSKHGRIQGPVQLRHRGFAAAVAGGHLLQQGTVVRV